MGDKLFWLMVKSFWTANHRAFEVRQEQKRPLPKLGPNPSLTLNQFPLNSKASGFTRSSMLDLNSTSMISSIA
jgi:hypothetical protein